MAPNKDKTQNGATAWILLLSALLVVYAGYVLNIYLHNTKALDVSLLCIATGVGCYHLQVTEKDIRGFSSPGFELIRDVALQHLKRGASRGFSVAAYVGDKLVVDISAGETAFGTPYTSDGLIQVWSSGKFVSSVAAAKAVDLGLLDYNQYVAFYWPEFAYGDKENDTVAHVLRHESGVPFTEPLTVEEIIDLDTLARKLVAQAHVFNGKTTRAYHAFFRDSIVGEIIRRTDPQHRDMGQFIEEEIAKPVNADFVSGAARSPERAAAVLPRWSPNVPENVLRTIFRALFSNTSLSEDFSPSDEQVKQIFFGDKDNLVKRFISSVPPIMPISLNFTASQSIIATSFSSSSNALSLAKIAAIMANGGSFNGQRIISEETVKLATSQPKHAKDLLTGADCAFTLGGFCLVDETFIVSASPKHFHEDNKLKAHGFYIWAGNGGSLVGFNPETKISFAYVMNTMNSHLWPDRGFEFLYEVIDAAAKTH